MLNSIILLSYRAIFGFGITGISYTASVSKSSALLMFGSLQQNVIDTTINE